MNQGVICVITCLAASLFAAAVDAGSGTGSTLQANGVELHYHVYGEGEPLLLLHGGLGHSAGWSRQVEALAGQFQVITVDSRGHGRSTFDTTPISYAVMAADVIALLDHLGVDRTHLVGWSDGGIVGLHLAIHHPQRLRRLVAYGANFSPDGVRTDIGENERFSRFIADAAADYELVSPAPGRWQEFLDNIGRMWATEPNYTAAELGAINTPVLVLAGLNEEAIVIEHVHETARLIPQAELALMADTGHFAHLEKPAEFNALVLRFLKRP